MSRPLPALVLLLSVLLSCSKLSTSLNLTGQTGTSLRFVNSVNTFLKDKYYREYRDVLRVAGPRVVQTTADHQCLQLLDFALANPLDHKWTAQLLDASGSLWSPGTLAGTITSFGDFDECLRVDNINFTANIKGKYCFVTLTLPPSQPKSIDFHHHKVYHNWQHKLVAEWIELDVRFPVARSICIPSICSEDFVRAVLLEGFSPLRQLDVKVDYCQVRKDDKQQQQHLMHKEIIIVSLVLGSMLVMIIIGTMAELWSTSTTTTSHSTGAICLFQCFSLLSNLRSLFSVSSPRLAYPWIDGFRCIFTLLMLLSHVPVNQGVLQLSALSPFAHFPADYQHQAEIIVNRYLINSTFIIKTFFMISGFLSGVSMCRGRRAQSSPSFVRHVLSRWLRFTPTLIGYIALVLVLSLLSTGPLSHPRLLQPYTQPCTEHFWMQMLYINNWFDFRYSCGYQTWYISADLQLYLVSYLVLVAFAGARWRRALVVCGSLIISSYMIAVAVFYFSSEGIPTFLSVIYPQLSIPSTGYLLYWTASHNHLEAYFLGMGVGILVGKNIVLSLSRFRVNTLYYLSLAALFLIPHCFPWFVKSAEAKHYLDLVSNRSWPDALLVTSAHACWLACFAWIFYASATFYDPKTTGGGSNLLLQFLSAPFLAPFARVSFCVYLVHVPLTWFQVHQARQPQIRNEFGTTQFTVLTYANSLLAAIALNIFFEAPFAKLTSMLLSTPRGATTATTNITTTSMPTDKVRSSTAPCKWTRLAGWRTAL